MNLRAKRLQTKNQCCHMIHGRRIDDHETSDPSRRANVSIDLSSVIESSRKGATTLLERQSALDLITVRCDSCHYAITKDSEVA